MWGFESVRGLLGHGREANDEIPASPMDWTPTAPRTTEPTNPLSQDSQPLLPLYPHE